MNIFKILSNKKIFQIILLLVIICIFLLIYIFNIELKITTEAILEVDQDKNMIVKLQTSNINLISSKKEVILLIEKNKYFLNDIEFVNLGNNRFSIYFENDNVYDLVKTNSLYKVDIVLDYKKIFDIVFNI